MFLSSNIVIVSKNLKSLQTNISSCFFIERKKSTNILVVSMLGTSGPTRWNTPQSVQTCWNPSEPVQICPDPFEPVETRSDLLKRVSPPPSPPSPPFSPFFFFGGGGGRGEGEGGENTTTKNPRKGVGGRSPPSPHRILTTKSNQNSLKICVIYFKICVIYLPTH